MANKRGSLAPSRMRSSLGVRQNLVPVALYTNALVWITNDIQSLTDIAHLYREINSEHSGTALKWYRGLKEAVLSLEEQPNRYLVTPEPVTPENDKLRHFAVQRSSGTPHPPRRKALIGRALIGSVPPGARSGACF